MGLPCRDRPQIFPKPRPKYEGISKSPLNNSFNITKWINTLDIAKNTEEIRYSCNITGLKCYFQHANIFVAIWESLVEIFTHGRNTLPRLTPVRSRAAPVRCGGTESSSVKSLQVLFIKRRYINRTRDANWKENWKRVRQIFRIHHLNTISYIVKVIGRNGRCWLMYTYANKSVGDVDSKTLSCSFSIGDKSLMPGLMDLSPWWNDWPVRLASVADYRECAASIYRKGWNAKVCHDVSYFTMKGNWNI